MPKLKIKVEEEKGEQFQIEMVKNGRSLVTGRGYNRRANAEQTVKTIVSDILTGNVQFVGIPGFGINSIDKALLDWLWHPKVCEKHGTEKVFYLGETEVSQFCKTCDEEDNQGVNDAD